MVSVSGILHTIILIGAVQGIVTGCLLFFAAGYSRSNRFLAIMIWLMAWASLNVYLNYTGWYYSDTVLAIIHSIIPMVIIMPVGSLLYFYAQSSLAPGFKMTKKQRLHFLPLIIDLVPSLVTIIFIISAAAGFIDANPGSWGVFIDNYNVYSDIPRWISLTCYIVLTANYLKNQGSEQEANFKWMQQFIRGFLVFQVIWLLYLIPYVIPSYTDRMLNTFTWIPIYVPMAVMIYWLGIKGYISYLHNSAVRKKNSLPLAPALIEEAALLLQKAMKEDEIYLNPDLNLQMLALHTGIAQKTISVVLNQHIRKNFNEFVNYYRVEAFKKKLQQPELDNLTIAGIAMECGFNSKATFQRIFKEFTSTSPSEFRKSLVEREQ